MMGPSLIIAGGSGGGGGQSGPIAKRLLSVVDPDTGTIRPFVEFRDYGSISRSSLLAMLQTANPGVPLTDAAQVWVERLLVGPGGGGAYYMEDMMSEPDAPFGWGGGGYPGCWRYDEFGLGEIPEDGVDIMIGAGGMSGDTYGNATEWWTSTGVVSVPGGVAPYHSMTDIRLRLRQQAWYGNELQMPFGIGTWSSPDLEPALLGNGRGPGMGGHLINEIGSGRGAMRGGDAMLARTELTTNGGWAGDATTPAEDGSDALPDEFWSFGAGGGATNDDNDNGGNGGYPGGGGGSASAMPGEGAGGCCRLRFWAWTGA